MKKSFVTTLFGIVLVLAAVNEIWHLVRLGFMLAEPQPVDMTPIIHKLIRYRTVLAIFYFAGGLSLPTRRMIGWFLGLIAWGHLLFERLFALIGFMREGMTPDIGTIGIIFLGTLAIIWILTRRSEFSPMRKDSQQKVEVDVVNRGP